MNRSVCLASGEDKSVIIFKFAVIGLGKRSSDKNELIIKFIKEINSAVMKRLAGALVTSDP